MTMTISPLMASADGDSSPQPDCTHHWVIESANGPTSLGRCKLCGGRREFFNDPDAVRLQRPG
jgi:hypothetical protein